MALTKLTKGRARWQTFKLKVAEAVSRSLYEKLLDQGISVKDFGAKGDGKSNDTEAIQTALNFSAGASARVYLPYGRYVVTETIVIPPHVVFEGVMVGFSGTAGSTLDYRGTKALKKSVLQVSATPVGEISEKVSMHCQVKNMNIECNSLIGFGVYCSYMMNNSIIDNIFVDHALVVGFYYLKSWYAQIGNIQAVRSGHANIVIGKALYGEKGHNEINGVTINYLSANDALGVDSGEPISPEVLGVGIYYNTHVCNYNTLLASGNVGTDIIDESYLGNTVGAMYVEYSRSGYALEYTGKSGHTLFIGSLCLKGAKAGKVKVNQTGLTIGGTTSDREITNLFESDNGNIATVLSQDFTSGRYKNTTNVACNNYLMAQKADCNLRWVSDKVPFFNLTNQAHTYYVVVIPNQSVTLQADIVITLVGEGFNHINLGRSFTEGQPIIRGLGSSSNVTNVVRAVNSGSEDMKAEVLIYAKDYGIARGSMSYDSFNPTPV